MPRPVSSTAQTQFVTVRLVAELTMLSPMSVYRLIESGELPAYRFGHSLRIPLKAVNEWIAASRVAPANVIPLSSRKAL